ncbi:hypothetical protein F5X96DRAFT_613616 [Biscogniauxia mediterranea]|nr:hypothetical protein F5X96DRAFT_613616 [Biscogniauxia mediterranea]
MKLMTQTPFIWWIFLFIFFLYSFSSLIFFFLLFPSNVPIYPFNYLSLLLLLLTSGTLSYSPLLSHLLGDCRDRRGQEERGLKRCTVWWYVCGCMCCCV